MAEKQELGDRLAFAVRAAKQAGAIAMEYFRIGAAVERKSDNSPVTIADRRAEQDLRSWIGTNYPGDAVLGEEFGETAGRTGWRWILDPIDGTESFIRGVPLFGVLIGVEFDQEPVLGVAAMPALGELVYAARGLGCWWLPAGSTTDDKPRAARVSDVADLSAAMILTTSIDYWTQTNRAAVYQRIAAHTKTRGWGDCYAHVLVATGRADAAIEPLMSIWDSAPFLPILEEAGGTYTDWQGNPTIGAGDTFSSNGKVFGAICELLK